MKIKKDLYPVLVADWLLALIGCVLFFGSILMTYGDELVMAFILMPIALASFITAMLLEWYMDGVGRYE